MRWPLAMGCALLLAAGIAAAGHGLWHLSWPADLPFQGQELRRSTAVVLILALLLLRYLAAARRGIALPVACVALVGLGCLATGAAAAVAALALACWSSIVLGRVLLRLLGVQRGASASLRLLAGAGAYGTAISLTASRAVHEPWVYVAGLMLPLLLRPAAAAQELRALWAAAMRRDATRTAVDLWLDAAVALLVLIHAAIALLPEIGHDALAMHLFVIHQLGFWHRWEFDVTQAVWAVMPMLGDWIFAVPYLLAGETAARLANVGFVLLVAALLRELVTWAAGNARGGRWCVLLFLATPLTFTESSSLFIESVWCAFLLAALLALVRGLYPRADDQQAPVPGLLAAGGLYAGFALAAKAISLTVLPVFALAVVPAARRMRGRRAIAGLGAACALVVAFGCIPYVRAWARTGNPVFPFFNAVFRSPLFPAENFESASVFGRGLHWDLAYQLAFQPGRFLEATAGAGGFQWLVLLVPALVLLLVLRRWAALGLATLALLALALTFQSVSYLRYVFPSSAILAAVLGVALSGHGGRGLAGALALAAAVVCALNLLFLGSGSPYRDYAFKALRDGTAREEWLAQRVPMRAAIDAVNALNHNHAPVAVLTRPDSNLAGAVDARVLFSNWYNDRFVQQVQGRQTGDALAASLDELGVEFLVVGDGWPAERQLRLLPEISAVVSRHGDVTVRRLLPQYRFRRELLRDPSFDGPESGWDLAGGARRVEGGLEASGSRTAFQVVDVAPGRAYLDTAELRCAAAAQARLQVNWTDSAGKFLRADIRVVDCGPQPRVHEMEVAAPREAARAVVYATGHGTEAVVFKRISFRR